MFLEICNKKRSCLSSWNWVSTMNTTCWLIQPTFHEIFPNWEDIWNGSLNEHSYLRLHWEVMDQGLKLCFHWGARSAFRCWLAMQKIQTNFITWFHCIDVTFRIWAHDSTASPRKIAKMQNLKSIHIIPQKLIRTIKQLTNLRASPKQRILNC